MTSRFCEICGIRYPIMLGPMLQISTAPLVAAFSEAGGLGCLAAAWLPEAVFREQVSSIRSQTGKPFAVNVAWTDPNAENVVRWCLEEEVKTVISSAGLAEKPLESLKASGRIVFQVVANVAQARGAEALGLDGVIAKGYESGGLNALDAVATLPLIPQVVDAVSLPVAAAGGIGDGRGLAAALALGAEGVLMGTRFLVSRECGVNDLYKAALVEAGDTGTVGVAFPRFSVRLLKTRRALALTGEEPIFELADDPTRGGELDDKLMGAGQVAGLLRGSDSVAAIIESILSEFESAVDRVQGLRSAWRG
ncbi:MAG: nitronate monooxygenase [Proteobacteria bacterium]|nr:nitronate monooxygenase [Pseudomonadota bacterium]